MVSVTPVPAAVKSAAPPLVLALPPTRSFALRRVAVAEGGNRHRLTIYQQRTARTRAEVTEYAAREFPVTREFGVGRGFRMEKAGGAEARDVFLSPDPARCFCDCEGFSYESARRADARHGDPTATLGCKHLDAAAALDRHQRQARDARGPADPLAAACDWCAGTGCVPGPLGELYGCPECTPAGLLRN